MISNLIITISIICLTYTTVWGIVKFTLQYIEKQRFLKMKNQIMQRELEHEKYMKTLYRGYDALQYNHDEY